MLNTTLIDVLKKITPKPLINIWHEFKNRKAPRIQYSELKSSELIYDLLNDNSPCMIARFGSVELNCVVNFLKLDKKGVCFSFGKKVKHSMENNAGFFPATDENLKKFSRLMLDCIPNVDILGSWRADEVFVENLLTAKIVSFRSLEPYYHDKPWSRILKGKKVLVIHPFSQSIEKQYLKRDKLFLNKNILPEFNLETITAVQSIAGNDCGYSDWFAALESMKNQIAQKDYDIAIIGCGAYGFPLASFVKGQGKKAIQLGGATQILFGIKGKRWDEHSIISKLYNEYWIRPNKEETPARGKNVENGCYW